MLIMNILVVIVLSAISATAIANPLLGLPPMPIPADNLQNPEKIALGKKLFHDARFSTTRSVSCASCHRPEKAFTDGLEKAIGINGAIGVRNTPTLLNAGFFEQLFLDGREPSLEKQALKPILNRIEHGFSDHKSIIKIITTDSDYLTQFKKVFDVDKATISTVHMEKAIASYERTLISGNSSFDQYYFGRDKSQLSPSAARGLRVFRRKGNCANCHEISWDNALFMDNRYYNIGVESQQLIPIMDIFVTALKQGASPEPIALTDAQKSALGRFQVTGVISDVGKFKTPTLRNIALTAPYMHDGSVKTLTEVVEYYDQGGHANPFLDAAIFPLHLTDQEKKDLVAFMASLTSYSSL
jgi:cytochrome c peroxidase